MLHLPTDRLAALGDDTPTPEEAAHLAQCSACAGEHAAYRALVSMANAEREPLGLPLTRWDAIAEQLARETPRLAPAAGAIAARRAARWPLQAAAGFLLVAGGMMAGRVSAGAGLLPSEGAAMTVASAPSSSSHDARLASDSASFVSIEEARMAQQRSEMLYQQAAAFLAQHDTTGAGDGSPVAYRSRLAALDRVISTTREAMRQAPHDPVINGYYLTTLGQREATLRQLNTSLPASLRVNSF
jgi:hypothetical protein